MHGVWDAMDLAGNAEERRGCWRDGVLKASCQPASAARKTTSHATSQAKPARSRAVAPDTAPCNLVSKAHSVTGCRFAHCAMQPRRQSLLGHGLSPYKKAKKQIFLRERAPDEICFYLFCMACSFREKKCLHYGKRYGRLIFAVT